MLMLASGEAAPVTAEDKGTSVETQDVSDALKEEIRASTPNQDKQTTAIVIIPDPMLEESVAIGKECAATSEGLPLTELENTSNITEQSEKNVENCENFNSETNKAALVGETALNLGEPEQSNNIEQKENQLSDISNNDEKTVSLKKDDKNDENLKSESDQNIDVSHVQTSASEITSVLNTNTEKIDTIVLEDIKGNIETVKSETEPKLFNLGEEDIHKQPDNTDKSTMDEEQKELDTSLTDILSQDIISEIDEILELNMSETEEDTKKKFENTMMTKKLVVLLPKISLDNTSLLKKDIRKTAAVTSDIVKKSLVNEVKPEDVNHPILPLTTELIKTKEPESKTQELEDLKESNIISLDKNDEAVSKIANLEKECKKSDVEEEKKLDAKPKNPLKKSHNLRHRVSRCYCEVCSLLFSDPRSYWNHRYLNHDNHEFGCTLCERKCKKVSSLIHHTKFKHPESLKQPISVSDKNNIIFFCESCGEGFSNVHSRLSHIQNFHQDKYILCNCCNVSFSNIDDLVFHAKKHQIYKDTNYTCKTCNRTIFFLGSFLTHIKHHDPNVEVRFKCKICSFRTTSLKIYEKHVTKHRKLRGPLQLKKQKLNKQEHKNKLRKQKQIIDKSYAFSTHVKGRRRYILKSLKNKKLFSLFRILPKRVATPHGIILAKAKKLLEIKERKENFKNLMTKLTLPNIPEINKILYVKVIKHAEYSKRRGTRQLKARPISSLPEEQVAKTEDFVKSSLVPEEKVAENKIIADTLKSSSETEQATNSKQNAPTKPEVGNEFKKPFSPAPKMTKKSKSSVVQSESKSPAVKVDTPSTPSSSGSNTKTDESRVKFEPGKTATDVHGVQKSAEIISYKIPKKDKPMPASKKSSIITGNAKHINESKMRSNKKTVSTSEKVKNTEKVKKSRFEPLPTTKIEEYVNIVPSNEQGKSAPAISNKQFGRKSGNKMPPFRPPNPIVPKNWNANQGPMPFDNSPFPFTPDMGSNQPMQFDQFGNNISNNMGNNMAWATAQQNLMSFGVPQPNVNNPNQGFMPPFGGQGYLPYQGPQQPGPSFDMGFAPMGPMGPMGFPAGGSPMMGPLQNFNASYFEPTPPKGKKQKPKKYICSGCEKEFPSPKVLELHLIFCNKLSSPHLESHLVCPVCSQTFEKRTVLKQHMFILHSKLFSKFNLILGIDIAEKHKCKICPQVFTLKQDKEAHEQTHIFLDAFNAVKAKQDKSATISAPPKLNKPSTITSSTATKDVHQTATSAMTKEQLAESAKKALQQIQSPAFIKKLEQQKKQLKINLQFLKDKKGNQVTSAPEKLKSKSSTQPQPVSAPKEKEKTEKKETRMWEFFPATRATSTIEIRRSPVKVKNTSDTRSRRRSRSRSRSVSPKGKSSRRKSRSISPRIPPRNKSPITRRRSRSKSPRDKSRSSRRSRSRDRARAHRRSRSTSRERRSRSPKRIEGKSKDRRSRERSQSPLRSRPKPKLNPRDAAYRCSKCAMLFSNFRDYANHKETHEESDDEESYLSLFGCPPPPPIEYGGYGESSSSYVDAYSCVVCLQNFKTLQLKDEHICSGPF